MQSRKQYYNGLGRKMNDNRGVVCIHEKEANKDCLCQRGANKKRRVCRNDMAEKLLIGRNHCVPFAIMRGGIDQGGSVLLDQFEAALQVALVRKTAAKLRY